MRQAVAEFVNSIPQLLCCLSPFLFLLWRFQRRLKRWDPTEAREVLDSARARAFDEGTRLLRVKLVYQRAERGSKALVRDFETGEEFDAWFWWEPVEEHSALLCRGSFGEGSHHGGRVLYVGSPKESGVDQTIPAEQLRAAYTDPKWTKWTRW